MIFTSSFQKVSSQVNNEITFISYESEITLSGKITIPENQKFSKAVVLLPIAGPTDRDLSLGKHKYYKVLAEGLAAKSIASIRYDDRGVGQSQGEFTQASLEERVQDACLAMKYLKKELREVTDFGYIGMSEGAGISVLASELCESVSLWFYYRFQSVKAR